jgi:tRNA threonylcarbamoyladenosine biosynthesis protein TsaB
MINFMDENSKIMALETSSRMGSVAVARGSELLAERSFTDSLRHAGELLPMMAQLTEEQGWDPCEINQLHISNGPGSFTGLRIGVTAAKTFTLAQPIARIVAVPSTDVLVQNALRTAREDDFEDLKHVAVVIDAKRKQIYTALYVRDESHAEGGGAENRDFVPGFRTVIPAQVCPPETLLENSPRPLYLLGPGLKHYREKLTGDGIIWLDEKYWQPRAAHVHRCGYQRARAGQFVSPDELVPFYLRRPDAVERWERDYGDKSITDL